MIGRSLGEEQFENAGKEESGPENHPSLTLGYECEESKERAEGEIVCAGNARCLRCPH